VGEADHAGNQEIRAQAEGLDGPHRRMATISGLSPVKAVGAGSSETACTFLHFYPAPQHLMFGAILCGGEM
jgi:hypothetical protein